MCNHCRVTDTLQILVVCTANICRSPAAAAALTAGLSPGLEAAVRVISAGTDARAGSPACELSSALVATYPARRSGDDAAPMDYSGHRSRRVSERDLADSDLILVLDRSHRSRLAQMSPTARQRTFTLRQAAALARTVGASVAAGALPEGAPSLPEGDVDRLRWFISELDAARGFATAVAVAGNIQNSDVEGLEWHPDDVPDPHVVGYQVHPMAVELIEAGVSDLMAAWEEILAAPITTPAPTSA